METVLLVTFVNKHSGKCFCGVSDAGNCLHKIGNVFTLPAEIEGKTYSGVSATVAHGDENIVLLKLYS